MGQSSAERKEAQRARDRKNGFKRKEVRIVDDPRAEIELHVALAKINRKYSK